MIWTALPGPLGYRIATPPVETNTPFLFSTPDQEDADGLDRPTEDSEAVFGWFFPIP